MRITTLYRDMLIKKNACLAIIAPFFLVMMLSTGAWSLESFETEEGTVLLKEVSASASNRDMTNSLRDPFNWDPELVSKYNSHKTTEAPPDLFNGLVLNGIMWNEQLPLAMINNTLLQEGDKIEESIVVEIHSDEVVLERENKYHILQFDEAYELDAIFAPKQ